MVKRVEYPRVFSIVSLYQHEAIIRAGPALQRIDLVELTAIRIHVSPCDLIDSKQDQSHGPETEQCNCRRPTASDPLISTVNAVTAIG